MMRKGQAAEIEKLKQQMDNRESEVADLKRQIEELRNADKNHVLVVSKLQSRMNALIVEPD